jgi:cytidine deaminase
MDSRTALIAAARDAAANAYAPYSNFPVGAALLLADGKIITAANVENASYGLTLCAETVAIAKAANAGLLDQVREVAVIGLASDAPIYPCGRCRQMLNEAAQLAQTDLVIHCASGNGETVEQHLLSVLLPHAFGPANLEDSRGKQ